MGVVRDTMRRVVDAAGIAIVVGIVIGLLLVPVAMNQVGAGQGTVAVVPIDGTITGSQATAVSGQLVRAREDPSIRAVVIVSNSGGGSAVASEETYMQVRRTAAEMPVVAAVDASAASGAYMSILPSERIFVKPSSFVGSVGVIGPIPSPVEPNNVLGTTGPGKLTGVDERAFLRQLETIQNAFLNAVFRHRGETLELSRTDVARARIYVGEQAVRNGFADEIGDRQAAIDHAADLAGIERVSIQVLRPEDATALFAMRANYLASTAPEKEMVESGYFLADPTSTPSLLLMPASVVGGDTASTGRAVSSPNRATMTNATARERAP